MVDSVITVQDTALAPLDTLRTLIADDTQFKFTHSPDRTTFVTFNAGAGTKFTNYSVGAGNADGRVTIEVDTAHQKFDKLRKVYSIANVGTGTNNIYRDSTVAGDLTTFNLRRPVSANTNLDIAASGSNLLFTVNSDSLANIGTGAELYRPSPTGTNPKVFNLRKLNGTGGVTVTQNSSDISIGYTAPTPEGICSASNFAPWTSPQRVVLGDGVDTCLQINTCGWQIPTTTADAYDMMFQPFGAWGCIARCPTLIDCTALLESIDDPNKLASVTSKNDKNGLFVAMIDVMNRQGKRITDLESPTNDNLVQVADRGTITAMQVARKVYEQQKVIDKQAKLIEELTARLDRIDRLQASK